MGVIFFAFGFYILAGKGGGGVWLLYFYLFAFYNEKAQDSTVYLILVSTIKIRGFSENGSGSGRTPVPYPLEKKTLYVCYIIYLFIILYYNIITTEAFFSIHLFFSFFLILPELKEKE